MTTTTPSPSSRRPRLRLGGFTLVEVMVSAALSSFVLAGVLSTFLFLGRSGANMNNYNDMEAQARKALEFFAEDTRQASAVVWTSATSLTLVVNAVNITYAYDSGSAIFTRATGGTTTNLLTGITTFSFLAYTITGASITDFSTATARTTANSTTKQVQVSLSAARSSSTVTSATNIVLSARYVLRNKRVTA
ncbi:MAG: prepilin-type N-terminal cleavage/methylation domain-containing protein [Opitutus sp.]